MIERQLVKLENMARDKQKELDRENYQKYINLFEPAITFLRKQNVLLYGGMALNELFPKELKFYDDATLPDIDLFTTNAIDLCDQLQEYYKKKGYPLATYKQALHMNTYKFFVSGLQLLDITQVNATTFKTLKKNSIRLNHGLKIRIVNREYLRMSLHVLLSQPKDSHRWGKAFDRLRKFYELYPPEPTSACMSKSMTRNERAGKFKKQLTEDLLYMITDTEYVLFGGYALATLVDALPQKYFRKGTCMDLIVEGDIHEVSMKFIAQLQKKYGDEFTVTDVHPSTELMSEHQYILHKGVPVIGVYKPQMCLSFFTRKKIRIASLHTICRMYVMLSLGSASVQKIYGKSCIMEWVTYLQVQSMKNPKKKSILQQFALECYGEQPGLITLRRNLFERK